MSFYFADFHTGNLSHTKQREITTQAWHSHAEVSCVLCIETTSVALPVRHLLIIIVKSFFCEMAYTRLSFSLSLSHRVFNTVASFGISLNEVRLRFLYISRGFSFLTPMVIKDKQIKRKKKGKKTTTKNTSKINEVKILLKSKVELLWCFLGSLQFLNCCLLWYLDILKGK